MPHSSVPNNQFVLQLMINRKTVQIGIPAHNEAANIASLIESILSQKGDAFVLQQVTVACDGCTDSTAHIVERIHAKNPVVRVIDDGKRLGQAGRLNQFYKNLTADIFITFDADVALTHDYVIEEIVKAFDDKTVGLVGGLYIPYPQKTLVGRSLEAYQLAWREMISRVHGGDNVHHHPGRVSAGSREFLKDTQIPLDIVANDHFLYFKALEKGFKIQKMIISNIS